MTRLLMAGAFALCCISIAGSLADDKTAKYALGPALVVAMAASAADQIEHNTKS